MTTATTSTDTRQAALDYCSRGWAVLPLPFRAKEPTLKGWPSLRLTPEMIPQHFNGKPQNIGVILGAASGWLVDVDLDHLDAVGMAREFLPLTGSIFGRAGKPESHFVYRVSAPVATHQRKLPDGTMIVELRSTGGQTVFPPSVHPSGERVEWHTDSEPLVIDPDELRQAVDDLADAVERHHGIENRKPTPTSQDGSTVEPSQPATADDVETARAALSALRPGRADAYDDWVHVGMALRSVSDSLFPDYDRWSSASSKYDGTEATARKWRSFDGAGITIASLVKMAQEDSPGWKPPARQRMAPRQTVDAVITNGAESMNGEDRVVVIPHTMAQIKADVSEKTGNWPRRVDGSLFVHDENGIGWLEKPAALFGFLHSRVGAVRWHKCKGTVGQAELFEELRRTATAYRTVETLPHEPMMGGRYYACGTIPPGDGSALRHLLGRFCPATEIDRQLILAALMTCMWGGPEGCRPAFPVTSDDGRGTGKSTLVELISELFGGILQFSHNEDIGTIKTRLLTPGALPCRVAMLDNLKSLKFSWGELEAMVTASIIGGHRMYCGEGTRPNTLVWFITLNGAALSCDMAQRSVIIKLKRPERSALWLEDTQRFVREHRQEILGDIIAALRSPVSPLGKFSRWATWEREVLQRLPRPAEAQSTILERQTTVDVDEEEAGIIEEFFAAELAKLGYDPATEKVHVPSAVAARWFCWATNERQSVGGASRIIRQMATEGRLRRLAENKCKTWGRGFVWIGDGTDVVTMVSLDLPERIAKRGAQGA